MTELQETLQELIEDVENIENKNVEILNELSEEEIKPSILTILNKFVMSKKDIDTLNSISNFNSYLNTLHKEEKLSLSQAFEAFTMLPPMIEVEINKNKYTMSPSLLNKKLFENDSKKINIELNAKISKFYEKLNDFISFYNSFRFSKNKESVYDIKYQDLKSAFELIEERLKNLSLKLDETKTLVIYNGKTYNLLLDTIEELKNIEDDKIDYKPYENKLSILIYSLYKELQDENIISLLNINMFSNLKTIIYNLIEINDKFNKLIEELDKIASTYSNTDNQLLESVNQINICILSLHKYLAFYQHLTLDKNIFKHVENLVELISN